MSEPALLGVPEQAPNPAAIAVRQERLPPAETRMLRFVPYSILPGDGNSSNHGTKKNTGKKPDHSFVSLNDSCVSKGLNKAGSCSC